jgi:hypothetical protein
MANSTFGFTWFARTTGVSFVAVAIAWGCGGTSGSDATGGASGRGGSDSGATGGKSSGGSSGKGGTSTGGTSSGGSSTGGTSSGGSSTGGTDVGAGAPNGGSGGGNTLCETCTCANGLDDDDDGFIDGFDPECTGSLDDDEGSFATGIPGDNVDPKWQDCFFDGNSGAGDDGCRYHTDCLTGDKPQDDPDCEVAQACIDFCVRRTTNGCDCFGCCTITTPDGPVDIFTTASCSIDQIDDEDACPRCVKSTLCENDCGECELCPGKTVDDLPESCGTDDPPDGGTPEDGGMPPTDAGDPPVYECNSGQQVCSLEIPCPPNYYCSLGCCVDGSVR